MNASRLKSLVVPGTVAVVLCIAVTIGALVFAVRMSLDEAMTGLFIVGARTNKRRDELPHSQSTSDGTVMLKDDGTVWA